MSDRVSFTSEYMYAVADYQKLRARAESWGNSKYLCFAPEAKWGENSMPILQGKIGVISGDAPYDPLCEFLRGVETEYPVSFLIHTECDRYYYDAIRVIKSPEGYTSVAELISEYDPEEVGYVCFDEKGEAIGGKSCCKP